MTSLPLLIGLLLIFSAALLFLYLSQMKSLRAQVTEERAAMSELLKIRLELLEQAEDRAREALESQQEAAGQNLTRLLQSGEATVAASSKAMQELHLTSMTGLQASESTMAKILQSSLAMIGTKDTLAYHQVIGGAAPLSGDDQPYTAVDDAVQERLLQEQAQIDAAAQMLENLGVVTDGSEGSGGYSFFPSE